MTVIIYFVLHVPSLKSLAEPMGSLLTRPLSAVPAVCKEAGFSFKALSYFIRLRRTHSFLPWSIL